MRLNAAQPVRWINAATNGFPMHAAATFLDAYDSPYLRREFRNRVDPGRCRFAEKRSWRIKGFDPIAAPDRSDSGDFRNAAPARSLERSLAN